MRLMFLVLTFLLFAFLLGFVATNLETEVPIQVFETRYDGVPLYLVGILAVFVGIAYAGILAVSEGAHIRLANRRMAREIHRLETEVNYLRTQPAVARSEPDALAGEPSPDRDRPSPPTRRAAGTRTPPSAPVYGNGDDRNDDDDDMYSGGRAV